MWRHDKCIVYLYDRPINILSKNVQHFGMTSQTAFKLYIFVLSVTSCVFEYVVNIIVMYYITSEQRRLNGLGGLIDKKKKKKLFNRI